MNPTSETIKVDETFTIVATVSPSNAGNKKVTWKSSNTSVATVDTNGKVTGIKAGTSTITCTTADGGKTATCSVKIEAAADILPTSVTLNPTSKTVKVGEIFTVTPTVLPSNATNKNVTWKSSNTSVATVDSNGKITGVKAGTSTVTCTTVAGNKTATCSVKVEAATVVSPTGVSINPKSIVIRKTQKMKLDAIITPATATNKSVTWSSSNIRICVDIKITRKP